MQVGIVIISRNCQDFNLTLPEMDRNLLRHLPHEF